MTQATLTPPPDSPTPSRPRATFIVISIALASALFLAATGVLYYRYASMTEPVCVIVVDAGPSLRGAQITVDNPALPKAYDATLGEKDGYSLAFYLDPGTYDVRVTLGDQTQFHAAVAVSHKNPGRKIDLTKLHTTTQPAPIGGGSM